MRKCYVLICLIIPSYVAVGQSNKQVEDHQFTINALLPGVVYEMGIAENSTLTAEATVGFGYRKSDFFGEGFGIYPIGRIQYRDYHNFERRLKKGKRISGNTGNYIAPTVAVQGGNALIGDLDSASAYTIGLGAVYGIQRTSPKGFQFRLEAGPAYFIEEFDSGFGLMLAAKVGWVIRKRK